jgi:[acyl-carrier-protein] S-malonyltransferase
MKDYAFLFPGQGSQVVGMGADLFRDTEFGRKTFKIADDILGYHFSKICFEGPEAELKLTFNTQPALLTVSHILFNLLGKEPFMAAGHSLGEYSALLSAGSFPFEDAIMLVHKRGMYMQEAVPVGQGSMAAIIGVDIERIKEVLETIDGVVDIANWNSASQIVISGEKLAVELAVQKISAPKAVFLPVSAPFHSPLMHPAEDRLKILLDQTEFRDLNFPVINNVEAKEMHKGDEARQALIKQVSRPVLWHGTLLKFLQEYGIKKYAEIGSGKVLAGLVSRTAKQLGINIEIINIQTLQDLQNFSLK